MLNQTQEYIENCLSELHDGIIDEFLFKYEDGLRIKIILPNGNIRYLLIKSVDRVLINNFREGNIILDAEPYFPNEIENSKIKKLYDSQDLNEYFAKNKLFAIEINPSYGAEIIFSCQIDSFKFCDASGIMSD